LIVMGELRSRRGALLVRAADGAYEVRASRGLAAGAPSRVTLPAEPTAAMTSDGIGAEAMASLGLDVLCPIVRYEKGAASESSAPRVIALLGLGPRPDGRPYGDEEVAFLQSVAACAATPI